MPITFVGEADADLAVVNLPVFTVGDAAVVLAFRNNSATPPSLPAGWTSIASNGSSGVSYRTGYRVLQSGDLTTSTWTNATSIVVVVLTGNSSTPIGTTAEGSGISTSMSFTTVALQDSGGTSWVILEGAHGTATDTNSVALAGTTNRASGVSTAIAAHTAENVTAWPTTAKTVNTSSRYFTRSVEILAAGVSVLSGNITCRGVQMGILRGAR